ncbi:MAG: hypothetical protein JWP10_1996 [Nocardioidaceae bacterium]|nr:hypothetical protein [Nocardioidaceae bacterium]
MNQSADSTPVSPQVRRFLLVAAGIVAAEGAIFVVLAGLDLFSLDAGRVASGIGVSLLLLGYGIMLLVAARQLLKLNIGARGPLVFAQLVQLGLAWGVRGNDHWWIPVALAGPALVVLVALLAPSTTQALLEAEDV